MAKSEDCNELFGALALAQGDGMAAIKDATGQVGAQKTKYADLASCWDACRSALSKHGLAVVQVPRSEGPKITVHTILGHKSGQWIDGELCMTSGDASPRGMGSAITYARRYSLCAMVGIAPEDDDGEAASRGTKAAALAVAEKKIERGKKDGISPNDPLGVGVDDIAQPSSLEEKLECSLNQAEADKFKALRAFGDLKAEIIKYTGKDQLYYDALKEAGYKKSNTIPAGKLRDVYRQVAKVFAAWKAAQPPIEEDIPSENIWPEVLIAFHGDEGKALFVLSNNGYEDWGAVPANKRAEVAMMMIEKAKDY